MLFLCTSLIIGGFRYRKKGGIVDLPLSVPWHRLWMRNTIVTVYSISLSLFKEILHPSGLDSSCEQRFILYFFTPILNDLYPPLIFEFSKVTNNVNNLSIIYRMPLVGSKSVHKRAGNTWSKKYLKFKFFAPLYPPYTIFWNFFFLEM